MAADEPCGYQIAQRTTFERPDFYGGAGRLRDGWRVPVDAPRHRTKREAICAYMRNLEPDLRAADDAFVVSHWCVWQRQGHAKVVSVGGTHG